jgi:hypothetical protein
MRRMALLFVVFSSIFCLAQQTNDATPVVPPAVVPKVEVVKPVQATAHSPNAIPPEAPKAAKAPCKSKAPKSDEKMKQSSREKHEMI